MDENTSLGEAERDQSGIHKEDEGQWFFGTSEPGILDASVFAYTFLLIDESVMGHKELGDEEGRLQRTLMRYGNLVKHMERLWERAYYRGKK